MASNFTTRVLGENWAKTKKSQERLSSGSRINHGADDAAGLSIGEHNRASVRSLTQAARNLADGQSLVTTAEGALSQIGEIIVRLRELSIQAASDTIGDSERGMVEKEVVQLKDEIGRIGRDTQFNGVHLLDGSAHRLEIQADDLNDERSSRIGIDPKEFAATLESLGLEDISLASKAAAGESMAALDRARVQVMDARTSLGAVQHELESHRDNVMNYKLSVTNTLSHIKDTDIAEESTELMKHNLITNANAAMLTQANQVPSVALKLLK